MNVTPTDTNQLESKFEEKIFDISSNIDVQPSICLLYTINIVQFVMIYKISLDWLF